MVATYEARWPPAEKPKMPTASGLMPHSDAWRLTNATASSASRTGFDGSPAGMV